MRYKGRHIDWDGGSPDLPKWRDTGEYITDPEEIEDATRHRRDKDRWRLGLSKAGRGTAREQGLAWLAERTTPGTELTAALKDQVAKRFKVTRRAVNRWLK